MKDEMIKQNPNKISKRKKLIITIFIIISILLITIGSYINYISNPTRVAGKAIDNIYETINTYLKANDDLDIGDTYTLDSTIKFNLSKDYNLAIPEELNQQQELNNLNKTINKVSIIQDSKKKRALATLSSTLNSNEIINAKYLIENSTEYYFAKDYLSTYVNNGANNYFESINENSTTKENYNYLYTFIKDSLKSNLKEEYFTEKITTTPINGKESSVNRISLELDNQRIIEIMRNILNDLKKDKKSNEILTNINENFSKTKIKSNTKILESKEKVTLNVYLTKLYSVKKYEIINTNNNNETKITYEPRNNNGTGLITSNGESLYSYDITKSPTKASITIKNYDNDTKVGSITLEKTSKRTSININFKDNDSSINLNYDVKLSNIKKNKSYESNITLNIKVINKGKNIISGSIDIFNTKKNTAKITEDVSNSVLESSISEEARTQNLQNYQNNIESYFKS